jgi:phenylacetate-CoA ligase
MRSPIFLRLASLTGLTAGERPDTGRTAMAPYRRSRFEHAHTLAHLWRNPGRSRERLERFRDRKLRFLVAHAHDRVAYYRELFEKAGVRPADVRCAADLERVPVSTKADFRERPLGDLVARGVDADRLLLRYTTGSTGEPTRVRRTAFEERLLQTFRLRTQQLLGRRVRDRLITLGATVPTDRGGHSLRQVRNRLGFFPDALQDCLRPIDDLVRDLARMAPDVVSGYPGMLTEIASVWPEMGQQTRDPRLVFVGGEVATPAMRARIRDGFRAPVFDVYGSREFNLLGWECAVTGEMHVCDDNVVVEVLRDGRPVAVGESGDVVVTGLHGHAVPYIRYNLGDTATRGEEQCRCGAPFSTLRNLRGRTMDFCVLPGGRKMHHWELIPMTFWDMPWHRRYQLVQQTEKRFALRVIADREPPPSDLEALSSQIAQTLGPGADFRLELVDDLAFSESGKHCLCRSEIGAFRSGHERGTGRSSASD